MEIGFFIRGIVAGILIAAPVGPIGTLCIRRTFTGGRVSGLVSGLGAATADTLYGCIVGFGLTFISNILFNQEHLFSLVGGVFLYFLGIKTFLAKPAVQISEQKVHNLFSDYASTFFLTLTNPMTLVAFAAIFAWLGVAGIGGNLLSALILVGGVFTGSALWWLTLTALVGVMRKRFNHRGLQWINRISGILIVAFGLILMLNRNK